MSNPEGFPGRLKRALEEKNQQKAALREKKKKTKARRIKREKRAAAAAIERQERINEEREQRNLVVSELDSRLPLAEYMEGLKSQLNPKEDIKRWGPDNGKIAYSLVYHTSRRKIHVGNRQEYIPGSRFDRSGSSSGYNRSVEVFRWRKTQAVLGAVLDHKGLVGVYNQTCAKKSRYHPKSINPLTWFPLRAYAYRLKIYDRERPSSSSPRPSFNPNENSFTGADSSFDLNSEEGLEKLTQNLVGFYLAQKG